MVLSGLACSLRRLLGQIRQAALSSCSRGDDVGSEMEVPEEDECAVQASIQLSSTALAPVVPQTGDRERVVEIGMDRVSPGIPQSTTGNVRLGPIKRKLDELEVGAAESSGSAASQGRPRREAREDVPDGIVPRSSGRELVHLDLFCPLVAQYSMWEDESTWNRSSDSCPGDLDRTAALYHGDAVLEMLVEMIDDGDINTGFAFGAEDKHGNSDLDRTATYDHGDTILEMIVEMIDDGDINTGFAFGAEDQHGNSDKEGVDYVSTLVGSAPEGFRVLVPTTAQGSETGSSGRTGVEIALLKEIGDGEDDGQLETSVFRGSELPGKDFESDTVRIRPQEKESDFDFELCYRSIDNTTTEVLEVSTNSSKNGSSSGVSTSSSSRQGDPFCRDNVASSDDEAPGKCSHPRLQFFVRTYMDVRTIVLHANAFDTIESVHWQIFLKTGLPISVQRLVYFGRQLQYDQTLAECRVGNDATLYLVARMHSTSLPRSWQIINELVATIRRTCAMGNQEGHLRFKLMQSQDSIKSGVMDFLKMPMKSVKMPMKAVPYSEHMQVFQLAGATSALVMLLLSPIESNRECAEDSIKLFLYSSEEWLPADLHCYCAPVILDFCKLLAKNAPSHNLYPTCRNALACLLDTIGVAHGSTYFNEAKPEKIVSDFAPFVHELSVLISNNLQWTARDYNFKERSIFNSSYVREGQDFTAFVIPLCKAMEVCKGIENPGSSSCVSKSEDTADVSSFLHDGKFVDAFDEGTLNKGEYAEVSMALVNDHVPDDGIAVEIGSQRWLLKLFQKLLQVSNNCLEAITEVTDRQLEMSGLVVTDEQPFGWAPFLVILKGLNAIAKLYEDAAEDLLTMLHSRRAALNVLIKQSRWQDDHFWLLEHTFLLDFDSRRKLVMAMLPEPKDDHEDRQEIFVNRAQLLSESVGALANASRDTLQKGISVEFVGEEATGPGVLREWFFLLCREIFNPQNALFLSCPNDCRRIFPNPASGVNSEHLKFFRVCGRIVALALMHRVQMDVVFSLTFFKQLAGLPISWEDARDADPLLYEGCKKILQMDAEVVDSDVLGLTFVCDVEDLGTYETVELCPGGKDMPVNSKNRLIYVEHLVHQRFVMSVAEQVKSFSQGFSDLFVHAKHEQFLRVLEVEDFNLMLYGNNRIICLEDWKSHTEYHDYSSSDDQIIWFWQVVEGMPMEQRRKLLFFSTSVSNLPAEGFAGLPSKFHIHKAYTDITWLPTAHTCFYQLLLPAYPSFEVMNARVLAVTDGHICEGFGFA